MKKIIALLLCICLVASMAACGKGKKSMNESTTESIATNQTESQEIESSTPAEPQTSVAEPTETEEPDEPDDSEEEPYVDVLSVKVSKHYQGEYSSEKECQLINCTYDSISLANESEVDYEDLNDRLIAVSDELNASTLDMLESCRPDAEEAVGVVSNAFEIKEQFYVRRADTTVLSFLLSEYLELGGVHPSYGYQAYNFDTATGNALELTDVVKDVDALVSIVKEQFKIFYPNTELFSEDAIEQSFADKDFTIRWVVDYTGLTIIYNTYEISSFADGAFFIPISFQDHPEVFKEKYTYIPMCYGVELLPGEPYYADMDNDFLLDSITVAANYDGDAYVKPTIYVNDSKLVDKDNEYNYGYSPMYIRAWGASYIFVEQQFDNDYRCISCYDYDPVKNKPVKLGDFNGGRHEIPADEATYYSTIECLTNTAQFRLDTRTEVLSSAIGTRLYRVDDGMPYPESKNYELQNSDIELTLLKKLTVTELDRYEDKSWEVTLDKGTKLRYVATDGKKKAYLESEDGHYYEVKLDSTKWPKTINKIDIEKIFDGTRFAG